MMVMMMMMMMMMMSRQNAPSFVSSSKLQTPGQTGAGGIFCSKMRSKTAQKLNKFKRHHIPLPSSASDLSTIFVIWYKEIFLVLY